MMPMPSIPRRAEKPAPKQVSPQLVQDIVLLGRATDARTLPTEREEIVAVRAKLEKGHVLTAGERARVETIAKAVEDRGPGRVDGSLLSSMPRPMRPPGGTAVRRPW